VGVRIAKSALAWRPANALESLYATGSDRSVEITPLSHAPVAQLDRALASEARGREFEPHQAHHKNS